jgi:hypothetical protein
MPRAGVIVSGDSSNGNQAGYEYCYFQTVSHNSESNWAAMIANVCLGFGKMQVSWFGRFTVAPRRGELLLPEELAG